MISSSFTCIACASRFCVFWMRNTMRNVTIVVPVLMTSCHVSLKPNIGPVTLHTTTVPSASEKAAGVPEMCEVHFAKRPKEVVDLVAFIIRLRVQLQQCCQNTTE